MKVGDEVARGQELGEVGMSGDAELAHVHLELREGRGATWGPSGFQGLPACFEGVRLAGGDGAKVVMLQSGEIVEPEPGAR